jgi:hypothetical protein
MRIITITLVIISLSACGLFKKSAQDDPTKIKEVAVAEEQPTEPVIALKLEEESPEDLKMAYGEVCEALLSTLQSGSIDQMSQYIPNVMVARAIGGKETNGKSDKDVQALIDGLTNGMSENIESLRVSAKENKVDLNGLRVRNCLYFDSEDSTSVINFLISEFSNGSKDYKVTLSIIDYGGKTYVTGITNTTNVFNKP